MLPRIGPSRQRAVVDTDAVEPGDARLFEIAEIDRVVHVAKRVHVAPAHLHTLDVNEPAFRVDPRGGLAKFSLR